MERSSSTSKAADNTYNAIALDITEDKATTLNYSDLVTASKNDIVTNIPGYSEEQGSLTMMITFLYIIAAFVLTVFFYVITIQKVDQFGMLKAIGAKTSYLAKSFALTNCYAFRYKPFNWKSFNLWCCRVTT